MAQFEKTKKLREVGKGLSGKKIETKNTKPEAPAGIYSKCKACNETIRKEQIEKGDYTCPHCNHYFRVRAYDRIKMTCDTFTEIDANLEMNDPLGMPGYAEKVEQLQEKTGSKDAIITGTASILGQRCMMIVMDSHFMMASMGSVVGEKVTRAFEKAASKKLPVVAFVASGGARMQEGMFSLMQMAKTSAAVAKFNKKGGLYINVLTHPTTGGVTASFAMLADITLSEPNALIGFAGPRVIEQTIGQKLPAGFQKAEFVLETGFVDKIVKREDMRETLGNLLALHSVRG